MKDILNKKLEVDLWGGVELKVKFVLFKSDLIRDIWQILQLCLVQEV